MRKSICYTTADGEIHSTMEAARDHAAKEHDDRRASLFEAIVKNDPTLSRASCHYILDFMEENHVKIVEMAAWKIDIELQN